MELIQENWGIIVTIVMIVVAFARLEVSVEVLQEKVRVLFELWNNKNK